MNIGRILREVLTDEVQSRATNGIAVAADTEGNLEGLGFGDAVKSAGDGRVVFRIASMSKSFLAALAHVLHDNGTIDLHASASDWLPDLRLRWQGEPVRVTLADLLSNRSGLPEDNAWGDRNVGMSREAFRELLAEGLELAAWPGTGYQYSNIGQAIVGAVIEEATGRTVADLVGEYFLKPLGMTCTAFTPEELEHCVVVGGVRTFDDGKTFVDEPFVGDGALACIAGMFSDAIDITIWARYLLSGFFPGDTGPRHLSAHAKREMQSGFTTIPLAESQHERLDGFAYGHGLMVETHRKYGRIVQHSGGLPGFSSHMRWHVATGTVVVVFGNSDSFGAGVRAVEIMERVLEGMEPEFVPPWPASLRAAERVDELIQIGDFGPLDKFAADNVLRDVPADVRERRLAELVEKVGEVLPEQLSFSERMRRRTNAAEVQWTVACASGELLCTARMTPHAEPLLQQLFIVDANAA